MKTQGFVITLVLLTGWGLVAGCGNSTTYGELERKVSVCASGPTLSGIDVSYWQGDINWDQVAGSGISFAFIRVSDGIGTYDTDFQYNWSEAKRVGIVRGVYQFFRPSQDPIAQANLLINEIGGAMTPGDLPPVIDVESNGGLTKAQVADRIQQWLDHVESALGVTPIIYASPGLWSTYVDSSAFSSYPLWVAHYYVTCPTLPTGWNNWIFHQYTDSGTVPGINTSSVDRNVFNGDLGDLMALTFGDPICGDGVCNGGESHTTCPGDCPVCEPVPGAGRIIDDNDICVQWGGDPQFWRTENDGYGGRLRWTHAEPSVAYNYAVWNLTFDQGGWYRVEAYTDATYAESVQAKYQVHHGTTTQVVSVNQTEQNGWTVIGEFEFAAGGTQWVRLEDLTGESASSDTRVVVDALRLIPVIPEEAPPASCDSIPPAGRIIDDNDLCLELGGDAQYWRTENDGHGGGLHWTYAVSSQVYNFGIWHLNFTQQGRYSLEIYTPAPWGESKQAKYQIQHGGNTTVVTVDQTATDGWIWLGDFDFQDGADQWVRIEDLTGEPGWTETRVVVDALRVTPVPGGTGSVGGGPDAAPTDSAASGGLVIGMGCNTSSSDTPPAALIWLLLPLALIRRRRR